MSEAHTVESKATAPLKTTIPSTDRDYAFILEDSDVAFEEDILRNPYTVKGWLRYLEHRKGRPGRNIIFERALKELPGSYKLWYMYLKERRRQVKGKPINHSAYDDLNNTYERCLVFLHKMPRIWIEYCQFMVSQCKITRSRHLFDRALRALPVTQHSRIWPLYLKFAKSVSVPETACRIYRRYIQTNPTDVEEYIKYLLEVERFDEAAQRLAYDVVNKEKFSSKEGKSPHQLWVELCNLISENPDQITSIDADAIIRSGLLRFTDMTGKLWISLADYYIRRRLLEKARDVFEEAILKVLTVRDFSQIFDAYAQFEESTLSIRMEQAAELESPDAELDAEIELRLARFEDLMDRRPLLLNSVLLRQNPHNIAHWIERAELLQSEPEEAVAVYSEAVQTVDARKATGSLALLWAAFAKFYEEHDQIEEARVVFTRATKVAYRNVDDLAALWCEYAEMEIRHNNPKRALELMQTATSTSFLSQQHQKAKHVDFFDQNESVQRRLHKSLKLWSFYVDLEESIGTFQSTKDVYNRILELRIATPQIIINFGLFLEENKYFEEAFKVYEKGVEIFKWPVVFDIWNTYLTKFIQRYGGKKLERARDLFEQALKDCPGKFAKTLYLLYGKLEEDFGLSRHAMAVYERATFAVAAEERFEMYNIYLKRASELFGITFTRPIFEKAIEVLTDKETRIMCLKFADMERKLGEIDRARAIYAHASQLSDPRIDTEFWNIWQDFEVRHGNEDTFREMLRIKRSVQAHYSAQVSYISAKMVAAKQSTGVSSATSSSNRFVAGAGTVDQMAQLEAQVESTAESRLPGKVQFVRSAPAAFNEMGDPSNPEEINLDVDEDETSDNDGTEEKLLEQKSVPSSVFGGITTEK